jgi:hypothetical protein
MNLRVPQNAANFLTSPEPIRFSRRTVFLRVSKEGCYVLHFKVCKFVVRYIHSPLPPSHLPPLQTPSTGILVKGCLLWWALGWKVRGSNPGGERFFAHVQTGPGVHPASCTIGTGSFPGVKQPGRGAADHQPIPSAEVENE